MYLLMAWSFAALSGVSIAGRKLGSIFLSLVVAVLLLSGCGNLPRPFKENHNEAANPLTVVKDARGIVVAPLSGAPPATAGVMPEMMADALMKRGLVAVTDGSLDNALLLEGDARGSGGDIVVNWVLTDAAGNEVARTASRTRVAPSAWLSGDRGGLERLAADAAAAVDVALGGGAKDAMGAEAPKIFVGEITGAPGDGNRALAAALRNLLMQAKIPTTSKESEATISVNGVVEAIPAGDRERITLTWNLTGKDGSDVGSIRQQNEVAKGALDGRWGGRAYDAALALVPALKNALDEISGAQ